ncbi:hypothetical protein QI302_02305 [Staphylococcus saprophyticus]|uniref:hypothetical protein n=1 Tax=Staphylococcus equorum TaxID=246432 RepID=UPI0008FB8B53|nr:hypothetical protein [Staphylococcus equorum]MDW3926452.1 hypothetical protein [Staphylococcus saprophyticus]MDW4219840.1 hypothetical protein [Staphylococcus saprophyticus]MDW4338248.1 hypothetical protein [Staphylococcus saprophyticus]OIS50205.1 hypothetical protein A4A29_02295 [Staphylococcus equorum]
MLNVLIYVVGAIAFAFLLYQTIKFVQELRASYKKGYIKVVVTFTIALVCVWLLYIGGMMFLIMDN